MSIREKQKARREYKKKQQEEFSAKTGIVNKFEGMSFEGAIEQFMYEMDKMERKEKKYKQMRSEDANLADYEDLTVTDDDYDEETRAKYA